MKSIHETTNTRFAGENVAFKTACETAGIPPTKRQASKWRNEYGKAYKTAFPLKKRTIETVKNERIERLLAKGV